MHSVHTAVNCPKAARNSTSRRLSVVYCCAVVTLLGSGLAALLGAVGFLVHGTNGLVAALSAVGVCWASELAAIVIQARFRDDSLIVASTLIGMMARMFAPLLACAIVAYHGGALAQGGFVYWTLAAYFVLLACHTVWFLPRAEQPAAG